MPPARSPDLTASADSDEGLRDESRRAGPRAFVVGLAAKGGDIPCRGIDPPKCRETRVEKEWSIGDSNS